MASVLGTVKLSMSAADMGNAKYPPKKLSQLTHHFSKAPDHVSKRYPTHLCPQSYQIIGAISE